MKQNRVTIKIGSNVLTRADGTLDITRLSALVDQVCQLRASGMEVIIISSGAVACGRSELRNLHMERHLDSVSQRQLFSAVGQVKLINRYYDLFRDRGIAVGQVLTMKESFATRHHYLNQRMCMSVMLDAGVVPIVNENDTVSVTELMFTDNDELSGLVATMMDCEKLVILSNIDGIYDGDPASGTARVIRRVDPDTDLSAYIQPSRSSRGRGGMATKHRIARKVALEGITVMIANGRRDGILTSLLLGEEPGQVCTVFTPSAQPASSLKRWIAHSDGFAKGSITLDAAAAEAAAAGGSVLPVGVTTAEGDFEKDDIIRVLAPDGSPIGVGRSAYSAAEALAALGHHGLRPIIHRDYLYIE